MWKYIYIFWTLKMNKILKSTQTFPNWPHTLTERHFNWDSSCTGVLPAVLFYVLGPGELESANFGFWVVFPLKFTVNFKTKTVSKFPHLLGSPRVTSQVLFPKIIRHWIFTTSLRWWRIKTSDFNIPISQQCPVQFVWICQNMFILWFIWPLRIRTCRANAQDGKIVST